MSSDQPPAALRGAPGPVKGAPPLASLGQRFLARLVDLVVLCVLWMLMLGVTGATRYAVEHPGKQDVTRNMIASAAAFLLYFVYEGVLLARGGQTLGKKLTGIRVAMLADGSAPAGRGWLRAAVYVLPGLLTPFFVGTLFWLLNSLWCLWDRPYQQCLHDKAARTVVVRAG
ncbi:RDD family protein [Streptomyces sp. MST-110588]|uniref:RDD family protein n=1 Tax=Streptomyces sp. MST-110588 TaxID=2833628 RepID=UPI001F5CE9F0|nr:RDD family protein [Streptomyces sp. MST-110588]UNO41807.1 RDD family protein [Streptomyces sp. MST-110588]